MLDKPFLSYVTDLFMAAKLVAVPPADATAEDLDQSLEMLRKAVTAFETRMAIINEAN
jgi:hypothetical protein